MAALSAVLHEIYLSSWPIADRRSFAALAIRHAIGGTTVEAHVCQPDTKPEQPIDKLEEVLYAIQQHGKLSDKPNIATAKQLLRQGVPNGAKFASRISRLSKARNSAAHPDVSLLQDITHAFDALTDPSTDIDVASDTDNASSVTSRWGEEAPRQHAEAPRIGADKVTDSDSISAEIVIDKKILHVAQVDHDDKPVHTCAAPSTVEDFLWNVHSLLQFQLEQDGKGYIATTDFEAIYERHYRPPCTISRFLVVAEGSAPIASFKRVPHIVRFLHQKGEDSHVCTALPPGTSKSKLVDADLAYRQKLETQNVLRQKANAK